MVGTTSTSPFSPGSGHRLFVGAPFFVFILLDCPKRTTIPPFPLLPFHHLSLVGVPHGRNHLHLPFRLLVVVLVLVLLGDLECIVRAPIPPLSSSSPPPPPHPLLILGILVNLFGCPKRATTPPLSPSSPPHPPPPLLVPVILFILDDPLVFVPPRLPQTGNHPSSSFSSSSSPSSSLRISPLPPPNLFRDEER